MEKILIADDDANIAKAVSIYLKNEGYETLIASNGKEAVEITKIQMPNLILLDIMMPVMDGIDALLAIREFSLVPIIMLTAKSEDVDKVLGLGAGADDYITKPFNPVELIARVKSQIRRANWMINSSAASKSISNTATDITIKEISINLSSKTVYKNGEEISVTPREYEILKYLMENPDTVFSPKEIYLALWQDDVVNENAVAVHIRHLREKLEIDPSNPVYLKVNWGHGYMFCSQ